LAAGFAPSGHNSDPLEFFRHSAYSRCRTAVLSRLAGLQRQLRWQAIHKTENTFNLSLDSLVSSSDLICGEIY
jgi:hypothetical protein